MNVGGRKLDDVWEHFCNRVPYKKGFKGTCKKCNVECLGKKETLLKHLTGCPLAGEEVRNKAREELKPKEDEKKRKPKEEDGPRPLKQAQFCVVSVPHVSMKEKKEIDAQIMRFFSSANIPF